MSGWQDPGTRRDVLIAVVEARRRRDEYRRLADTCYHLSSQRLYETQGDQWDTAAHQLFHKGRTYAA